MVAFAVRTLREPNLVTDSRSESVSPCLSLAMRRCVFASNCDRDRDRALAALAQAGGPVGDPLAAAEHEHLAGADRPVQHLAADGDRAVREAHPLADQRRQLAEP